MNRHVDIAIMGSGFGGSMLATLLAARGRRVLLVDQQVHPRFSIGESSTPLADQLLRWMGNHYGQPDWVDLSSYGSWKREHPNLDCGLKRGFTYYQHQPDLHSNKSDIYQHSLLVAASRSDSAGDTHWHRPSVDQYFYDQAVSAGVESMAGYQIVRLCVGSPHRIWIRPSNEADSPATAWSADTVIDATGRGAVSARHLRLPDGASRLRTRTGCVFGHVRGLERWTDRLVNRGYDSSNDPYDAEHAAVHHLSHSGWMWNLHFDSGLTSIGYTTTETRSDLDWNRAVSFFPELAEIFEPTQFVVGPMKVGRIQRSYHPLVASRWWMLPSTALTIDPLHSTGIAMQLAGVARIANALLGIDSARSKENNPDTLSNIMIRYRDNLRCEGRLLDELVSTAYHTLADFDRFCTACMLFFLVAIRSEERVQSHGFVEDEPLFEAGDVELMNVVRRGCFLLRSSAPTAEVNRSIRRMIEPYNEAGLCREDCGNRYAYTATKR